MVIRLLASIALLAATAFAEWPRYVSGEGKGGFTDSPPAHPLAYFQVDPCLRPASDSLRGALGCGWAGKPPATLEERRKWAKTSAELEEVGRIGKFTIFDLWYQREDDRFYPDFSVRSVLVKTAADRYREINVQSRWGNLFPASEIVILDGEPILIAKFHDGGNHNRIDEMLYMFRSGGLVTPNFTAVGDAANKLRPQNMSVVIAKYDYSSMTYLEETFRNDLNLPRVAVQERARITVTYRFVAGRAVVTSSKYEPHSQ